ncbi:MAG: hypothetical protein VX527_08285 [Planctomycetota bacterium]|nr:hypothetical protein [Planctomycetota bacterium]
MPIHDWQFWVVTAFALGAAIVMLRPILSRVTRRGAQRRATRASLTIEGRQVNRSRGSSTTDD